MMDTKSASYEKSEMHFTNEDADLYEILMKNLDQEPSFVLPDKFGEKTIKLAFRRKMVRDILWNAILFCFVSVPLISIILSVVYFMGRDWFWKFIEIMESEGRYFLFAAIGLIFIQLLDKLLIQSKFRQIRNR
jgi:hypothetical protein